MEVQQKLLPGILNWLALFHPTIQIVQANFLRKKSTFPPPFQWIYYIALLVDRCKRGSAKDDKKCDKKQKIVYLELLKELILTKQKNEFENSEEDNREDLRAHLKQDMAEEMQKMKAEIMDKLSK